MGFVATVLTAFGVVAYLALGFLVARWLSFASMEPLRWWQIALVILLWPLAPLAPLLMVIAWMRGGSH